MYKEIKNSAVWRLKSTIYTDGLQKKASAQWTKIRILNWCYSKRHVTHMRWMVTSRSPNTRFGTGTSSGSGELHHKRGDRHPYGILMNQRGERIYDSETAIPFL